MESAVGGDQGPLEVRRPHRARRGRGRGEFRNGASLERFGPGDVLFVPAMEDHRFERFTDDLVVWVIFYGPEGGEAALGSAP